ncbi:hypothetical protein [Blastococcus sp. SYSU D01042]
MTSSPRGRLRRFLAVGAALVLAGCAAGPGAAEGGGKAAAKAVPATAADDLEGLAYEAFGCASRTDWVAAGLPADAWDDGTVRRTAADVTGDGVAEVLVQAGCPSATSTPASRVVVLDVSGAAPALLGVLGGDLFFPEATVSTAGATVTLSGPTVAGDDPTCCPGHVGTVTYAWDGARFVVEALNEVPGSAPVATR